MDQPAPVVPRPRPARTGRGHSAATRVLTARAEDRRGRRGRGHRMSDHEPEPPPENAAAPDGELVLAEEGGVRVFYIAAPTMQDLVDRLALVLGEHMRDGDELHVTYNAMQSGWTEHPA